ncbi:MAG: hypothetical protein ACR2IH_04650 [Pyrinomonadaceae bacterium]
MSSFTSVPFKTESGMSKVNGVAKFSSAGVVLEFESKLFGVIPGGVKEARIHLADILDLKFRKGVFKHGARIDLRAKSFTTLAALPNKDGKLTLKLVADDFDRAQEAVVQMQKYLNEHAESSPPSHTPLSELFSEETEEETKTLGE